MYAWRFVDFKVCTYILQHTLIPYVPLYPLYSPINPYKITGEKVSQGKIRNRGLAYTKTEFPLLDYITSCDVIAREIPWTYVRNN